MQNPGRKRVGDLFIDRKILTPAQVQQVLEYGRTEGLKFGQAAIEMGLVSEEMLARIFGKSFHVDFFHLESKFFPKETSQLLSVETIIRYGVLPLGLKTDYGLFKRANRKMLNLGMLDPGRKDALEVAVKEATKQGEEMTTRTYLVLGEQFMEVLEKVYGVSSRQLAERPAGTIDPTLSLFLEK